jgi:hypothetical protein
LAADNSNVVRLYDERLPERFARIEKKGMRDEMKKAEGTRRKAAKTHLL